MQVDDVNNIKDLGGDYENKIKVMQEIFGKSESEPDRQDWKERFRTEYSQLIDRRNKLERIIVKAEAGTLDFEPASPIDLLQSQLSYMTGYLHVLMVRAEIEGVEL